MQSGGVGIALLRQFDRLGIGVSTFVSLGDKYDVSGNDMLQWFETDPRTELAVLHLESFGNPRDSRASPAASGGPSSCSPWTRAARPSARRAAASHTAAAVYPDRRPRRLFRQAGVTATHSIGDLVAVSALMSAAHRCRGTARSPSSATRAAWACWPRTRARMPDWPSRTSARNWSAS
ncbi:hypothetical protein ACU686_10840 [Yinghuangia aomiensis]